MQFDDSTMRLDWVPEKKLHARLARNGIRIFKLHIAGSYGCRDDVFIHGNKTTEEWRNDVRQFLESDKNSLQEHDGTDADAMEGTIPSRLYQHLRSLGYCDIDDVVSDIFEGSVVALQSRIVDAPDHEEQTSGFGHFGWESKSVDDHGPTD